MLNVCYVFFCVFPVMMCLVLYGQYYYGAFFFEHFLNLYCYTCTVSDCFSAKIIFETNIK